MKKKTFPFGIEQKFWEKLFSLSLKRSPFLSLPSTGFKVSFNYLKPYGDEFYDYKIYQPPEDISRIDWNIYGRLEELYVKRFLPNLTATWYLVLDISGSMNYVREPFIKSLIFFIYYILVINHHNIKIITFNDKMNFSCFVISEKSDFFEVLFSLENSLCFSGKSFIPPLSPIFKDADLVIVMSDMCIENYEYFFEIFSKLRCILLHFVVDLSSYFSGFTHYQLHDIEWPTKLIYIKSNRDKRMVIQSYYKYIEKIQYMCRKANIKYLQTKRFCFSSLIGLIDEITNKTNKSG